MLAIYLENKLVCEVPFFVFDQTLSRGKILIVSLVVFISFLVPCLLRYASVSVRFVHVCARLV